MSKNGENESAANKTKGLFNFDPSGLERAAKAVKFLDGSANAKNAFEIAMKEEEKRIIQEKRLLK
jgi:hypothetical protein